MAIRPPPEADRCAGRAYGLDIVAEFDLPELASRPPSTDSPDAVVVADEVRPPVSTRATTMVDPTTYVLDLEAAALEVRNGERISFDAPSGVPDEVLRHIVLGPGMHHLLHQRGRFVLHASVVEIDGRAVAFTGPAGRGKTTMAAACLLAGHRVISDDVAAIEWRDGEPVVRRGYPWIKLDEAFVDRFDPPVSPPIRPSGARDRHFYGLPHEQPAEPIPLAAVYVLTDGDHESIDSIEGGARITTLSHNVYASGLMSNPAEAATAFEHATALTGSVPVKRLTRRRTFDALGASVDQLVADLDDGA